MRTVGREILIGVRDRWPRAFGIWLACTILIATLLTGGCAGMLPVEQHGGLNPRPSKVSDIEFIAIGAALDVGWEYTGQKLLRHVPLIKKLDPNVIRFGIIDQGAGYCVRACSTFGRPVDSWFLMDYGAALANFGRFVIYHSQHPSHPSCTVFRGPDTVVAVGHVVQATPVRGQLWGTDCLTPEQVRRLWGAK